MVRRATRERCGAPTGRCGGPGSAGICGEIGWRGACGREGMSYVIAEPCAGSCEAACVKVCPCDSIHGPPDARARGLQMYIDAESCIDCGACEGECPVGAIFEE